MSDYRLSHQQPNRGLIYDCRFNQNRTRFYWRNFEEPFLENLFRKLAEKNSGEVLDFACGTGRISKILNKYFDDITGIDVSEEMLKEAIRVLPGAKFVCADITRAHISKKFKIIVAFRFFLNAQQELREEVCEKLSDMLEPGGILVANNHLRAESVNGRIISCARKLGLTRRNCLADENFENMLHRHGFSFERVFSFCRIPGAHKFPPVFPGLWLRLEKMLGRWSIFEKLAEQRIYICYKN